jgi:two-component system, OmpR family, response regulator ChvI
VEGLDGRTVGVSFNSVRVEQLGEWVMGQLDARLGRRSSSIGVLNKIPTVPPSAWDGTFNRRESDRLSSSRPAPAAFQGEIRRVVLVESDQYYREVLTEELLRQGFAVHPFADGAALLGSLATAVHADLAVLDWDLPGMPGITLLAQLRQHGVQLPVVFLTGKVIATKQHERCVLAPRDALNAYECMAFDQGAVDFISKSRDRQVIVRRLRKVVEPFHPEAEVALEEHLTCGKLVLNTETSRACWSQVDVGLTLGEYNIVHLLASNAGSFVTYRGIYDRLRFEGFIAGTGNDGYRANVRSVIKRIRNKFRAGDAAFNEIENYTGFGYCWRRPVR